MKLFTIYPEISHRLNACATGRRNRFPTVAALFWSLSLAAFAQSGLNAPTAGLMVDHSGALRTVTGIAQSFLAGDALRTGVLSAACGRSWCVVKTATSLLATPNADDPATPAPAGPALFSLRKQSALAYFPVVHQFARFENSQLHLLDWSVDGEVLALRSTREGPQFAVRRSDAAWIVALDGSIQDSLPAGTVAVLLVDGATVYSLADTVVLRRADGSEILFDLPGAISLSQLGENYAQVSTAGATYALRLDLGRETISVLPDLVPASAVGVSQ
jgi:hypothetical protein